MITQLIAFIFGFVFGKYIIITVKEMIQDIIDVHKLKGGKEINGKKNKDRA